VRYALIERGGVQIETCFNINFIVVERTNDYDICHPLRSYHYRSCIIVRSRLHAPNRTSLLGTLRLTVSIWIK